MEPHGRQALVSRLRPEVHYTPGETPLSDDTALFLMSDAVDRRQGLIYGRLNDGRGGHCAIGALWADHPHLVLSRGLVDEVAAVNDSVPPTATAQERWRKVRSWLRWKLRVLATGKR